MAADPELVVAAIPADAVEVFERREKHANLLYSCVLDGEVLGGEVLGYRRRNRDGVLTWESQVRNERLHGTVRQWTETGELMSVLFYVNGVEHGTAEQYCHGGLLGTYTLDHGTGIDLWRVCGGALGEERHLKAGNRHGFERWWYLGGEQLMFEQHFTDGVEHGIFRQWSGGTGTLKRGYPRYFVKREQVTKRQYLRAAASDPTLPPFRPEDQDWHRLPPPEHAASLAPDIKCPPGGMWAADN